MPYPPLCPRHETERKHGAGKGNWGLVTDDADAEDGARDEAEEGEGPEAVSPRDFEPNEQARWWALDRTPSLAAAHPPA